MLFLKKLFGSYQICKKSKVYENPVFCIMPWVHFHITQYGTVTPCCQAPWQEEEAFGNINEMSIDKIWNNSPIKSFRKNVLSGKVDKRCESCFLKEKSGYTSLRQITNHKYHTKFDLALESSKNNYNVNTSPIYFDIRFSNVCNLKCRICGPWSSSSWYTDALELGMIDRNSSALTKSFTNTKLFFDQFKKVIDSLEELYFAGGEPLVTDEHYQILQLLINQNKTDVRLTYNTNFSSLKYKNYDIIKLWKHFPNISVAASLDASGNRGELLRKNLRWADVVHNRLLIKSELPHIEFIVSPTLNAYNLFHLPDFHLEWVSQDLIKVEDFIPTLLVKPQELSILSLPNNYKAKVLEKYKIHLEWILVQPSFNQIKREHMIKQFENIIQTLSIQSDKNLIQLFENNFEALDNLRQESTLSVFPELKELFTN